MESGGVNKLKGDFRGGARQSASRVVSCRIGLNGWVCSSIIHAGLCTLDDRSILECWTLTIVGGSHRTGPSI